MRDDATAPREARPRAGQRVRVMTYNIRACIGADGQPSIDRIASVIAAARPDVAALQEVDVRRVRTGGLDQARLLADRLEMEAVFEASFEDGDGRYGIALLSRLPMRLIRAGALPTRQQRRTLEPRTALWTGVQVGGLRLDLFSTHLGLDRSERRLQIGTLLGEEWLSHPDCGPYRLLCGDLNAGPRSSILRSALMCLTDAQHAAPGRPRATWPSMLPLRRIDHVLVSETLAVHKARVLRGSSIRRASDHLPLVVELSLVNGAANGAP